MQTTLEVPFYSQHWELDHWSQLGFGSRKEAEYWMWSSCGVLALKSAIDAGNRRAGLPDSPSIREYIRQGQAIGAYTHERGWIHAGLVALAGRYGAAARTLRHQRVGQVAARLESGNLVIASVRAGLAPRTSMVEQVLFWRRSGGHLVLVKEFRAPGTFIVNHPSARAERNWESRAVTTRDFARTFTGSAIVVSLER